MTKDELIDEIAAGDAGDYEHVEQHVWPLIVEFVAAWMDHGIFYCEKDREIVKQWRDEMGA